MRLLLTHGTATGREAGAELLLRDGDRQTWLPYDTPARRARFLAQFRPAVGVLMETEVWPNLLHAARARGVPMVLANARLSEQQPAPRRRRLARADAPGRRALRAGAGADARPMPSACASRARATVEVCGNLKFDMTPDAAACSSAAVPGARCWARPVVLGGEHARRRRGDAARRVAARRPRRAPLLADRAAPSAALRRGRRARRAGAASRSRGAAAGPTRRRPRRCAADVWLGDSMGEMPLYYALADVALLGGSFAPLGGQNLIEAAACGCPVVMGPHTFNFAQAAELSLAAGAALRVARHGRGRAHGARWLHATAAARRAMARRRSRSRPQHRGAAQRMAERIVALTDSRARSGSGSFRRAAARCPFTDSLPGNTSRSSCARRPAGGRRARLSAPRADRS